MLLLLHPTVRRGGGGHVDGAGDGRVRRRAVAGRRGSGSASDSLLLWRLLEKRVLLWLVGVLGVRA